ncbi:MAG: glycosyltransferase family 39 protein [Bacteroidales bacterium]|nr:glycosyltransferase family 39 protein [Bacteroidales bacterium]
MKSLISGSTLVKKQLLWLIVLSTITRALLALILDLGSNEAYYWTYGSFPDISHIDHPPMIGWFIQLFTVNMAFEGEFFLRLAAIVTGSLNTWIIFVIGRRLRNERTGLYAALLYTASLYCSLFVGTFINPDTPQSLFILLSIYFLNEGLIIKHESCEETKTLCRLALILAGIFTGLAMLSKYSSVFIWAGVFVYILSSNRRILKEPYLYISVLISFLFLLPVYLWNVDNNFISFAFQSSRLPNLSSSPDFLSFAKAIGLIFLYNNPLSIAIMLFAVIAYKKEKFLKTSQYRLLISLSLPILIFFIAVALFTESKANWSAPGFFPLMFIGAAYLDNRSIKDYSGMTLIPPPISNAISLTLFTALLIFIHHFSGIFSPEIIKEKQYELGKNDITLEYFGWRTLSKEFSKLFAEDVINGEISENCFILSSNWAQASHMDFYLAAPSGIVVKTIGKLEETRKYAWITGKLGTFRYGENAYFIESSRDFPQAEEYGKRYFTNHKKAHSVYIKKIGKPVLRFDIYIMKNLKRIPERELSSYTKY